MNRPVFPLSIRWLRGLLALLLLAGAGSAHALCTVVLGCTCTVTTTNLNFGNYNPLAFGTLDTTGTVTVKCGGVAGLLIPFTIDLGKGLSTSYTTRTMGAGGNRINYNLYADNAYTQVWGDGTGSSFRVAGNVGLDLLGLSPGLMYTVYGRIPGRQLTVPPGSYTDAITVTLTYD